MKRSRFSVEQIVAVLKQLQEENARLKKLVADLSLDKAILQDVAQTKWGGPRGGRGPWTT